MSMKNRSKHGVNTARTHLSHSATSSVSSPHQAQSVATVSVNPQQSVFNVDGAFKTLEKIRRDVNVHHEKYFLQGRKAMLEIMSQVYLQFKNAQDSDEFDLLMGRVRDDLNKACIKYSRSSSASSQLITFLFASLTYKQTHVYSRAIDEAYCLKSVRVVFSSCLQEMQVFVSYVGKILVMRLMQNLILLIKTQINVLLN